MIEELMGRSLRLLNRIAGSERVDRWGLREPGERAIREGVKTGFDLAQRAAKAAEPLLKLTKPARLERPAGEGPKRFDLDPTEEQQLILDTVRRFAKDVVRPAAEEADAKGAVPKGFLDAIHELGFGFMAVPEAAGGAGESWSPTTNVLVAAGLAFGDMALALAGVAPLAVAQALTEWGTAAQQSAWLGRFTGEAAFAAALAVLEPTPLFDPAALTTRATLESGSYRLDGVKSLVPLASTAELFLVAAEADGRGPSLFLVTRDTPGLTITPDPAMGLRAADLGRLTLAGARVPRAALLGGAATSYDHGALIDRSRLAWAALALGTGRAVLEYVKTYVNERVAFGEPISNRQAVAFTVADMAVELDGLELLVLRAASRAEAGLSYRREAYLAHLFAVDKGMQIGTDGVQMLGGAGFVKDHPVERWYRDLRGVGVMAGAALA